MCDLGEVCVWTVCEGGLSELSPGLDNSTELDRKLDSYSTGYSTG